MQGDKEKVNNVDEDVNFYYNTFYSGYGSNLDQLKAKIDEDFFKQEENIADLLKSLEQQKESYQQQLSAIEGEYDKLLNANKAVFSKIDECNKTIEGYQKNDNQFRIYLQNLNSLETEIDKLLS